MRTLIARFCHIVSKVQISHTSISGVTGDIPCVLTSTETVRTTRRSHTFLTGRYIADPLAVHTGEISVSHELEARVTPVPCAVPMSQCVEPHQTIVYVRRSPSTRSCTVNIIPVVKVACKSKVFPYSLPKVGPGADPGVQTVSPQVTLTHPPGGRLPLLSDRPAVKWAKVHQNFFIGCYPLRLPSCQILSRSVKPAWR